MEIGYQGSHLWKVGREIIQEQCINKLSSP
jgi:hypothetical protein